MDSFMPAAKPKRMDKEEQALIAQLARSLKISVAIDVYDWCELGERWSDREDTSTNVVSVRLPRLDIKYSLPLAWAILSKLPNLSEIRLDQNDLEGGLPETIPNNLERLYIDNNPRLGGHLPQSMRFRNISVLWLNNCGLKGQIPYSIGDMWALKHLNLGENKLTGRLPDSWGSLVELEVLDLRQNKLKGSLPRSFRDLSKLVQLDLSYNKFSGEIPKDRFAELRNLKWLNLSNCNFLDSEKSHRELKQTLPTTYITAHVPKKVYVPAPRPTYPRDNKYTQQRAEELARLKPKPVVSSPSIEEGNSVDDEGDKEENKQEIELDENGIPVDINESHADNISDGAEEEEDDDDEDDDDEDDDDEDDEGEEDEEEEEEDEEG